MALSLVPLSRAQARRFIAQHHRHSVPPCSDVIRVGLEDGGQLVGVGMAEVPARGYMDGRTLEVTRVCTDGTRNACSMLYGALTRAAFALGYTRLVTYIRESEDGASLRAAGWTKDEVLEARGSHRDQRRRPLQLFEDERRQNAEGKVRYLKLPGK